MVPFPIVNGNPLLKMPLMETVTGPVVAPVGTGTTIPVSDQLVGLAGIPLNATVLEPWLAPRFIPDTETAVPGLPEFGAIVNRVGATVKEIELEAVPFTDTTTGPVVASAGTSAVIVDALQLVTCASIPLKEIRLVKGRPTNGSLRPEVASCDAPKPLPDIVTGVPVAPAPGEIADICGEMVNRNALLARVGVVTTTGPEVALEGTTALMVESLQLNTLTGISLNVIVLVPCVDPNALPATVTVDPTGVGFGEMEPIPGANNSGMVNVES